MRLGLAPRCNTPALSYALSPVVLSANAKYERNIPVDGTHKFRSTLGHVTLLHVT